MFSETDFLTLFLLKESIPEAGVGFPPEGGELPAGAPHFTHSALRSVFNIPPKSQAEVSASLEQTDGGGYNKAENNKS